MKIRYIDGFRLKQAIIAGSRIINRMQSHLDKINVFPVPDGDTGTNMASTMNHITNDLSQCSDRSVAAVSSTIAESAILGAQGNSGAILAQFFSGFATAVKGKIRLTTASFSEAIQQAEAAAYNAISDPREGTILTVIKDWVTHIQERENKTHDFVDLLKSSLHTAKNSLADTPKKLKVLAKAGVVDAGAQGFVHLLEGIYHFIEKGKISNITKRFTSKIPQIQQINSKIKFRYCTDCLLTSNSLNSFKLKQQLHDLGDSLIVANVETRYRVHIHTNYPDQVIELLQQCGTVESKKIDDMMEQQFKYKATVTDIAIVTDSSCDLPYQFLEENQIFIVPTNISFGSQSYRDKIDILPNEFYEKLVRSDVHPTTSQPTLAAFKDVYEQVVDNYNSVISIHLPRVVSGTMQRAEHAAALFGENKIHCVDGKNISIALGFVVMEAVNAVNAGKTVPQILEIINNTIRHVHIFVSIATIDYMIRGGRISKQKGLLAKILNLKPIITFDDIGKAVVLSKAIGERAVMNKTLHLVKKKANLYRQVKLMVAHANAYESAEWYVQKLKNMFNVNEIPIVDAAPVLGVHAGPGTAAVAMLGYL